MTHLQILDRPIAFHRCLVDLCGSIEAALMLSQAIYWSNRIPKEREGWFWKTMEEWTEETGLTRREQERARTLLKTRKLLDQKLEGVPAKLSFRVVQTSLAQAVQTGLPYVVQTSLAQAVQTPNNTETTSESTLKQQSEVSLKTKEHLAEFEAAKRRVLYLFNVASGKYWGNMCEQGLALLMRRESFEKELRLVEKIFSKVDNSKLPRTPRKLLDEDTWFDTVIRANKIDAEFAKKPVRDCI